MATAFLLGIRCKQSSCAQKGEGRLDERKVARRVKAEGTNQSSRRFMDNAG